ncbi:MAG: FAD-dependent oxidoreductase, partial [Thermodesulfobacteriota bacterium]
MEREELGGTCLHRGCVPTKGLLRAVEVLDTVRRGKRYGVEAGEAKVDFPRVRQYKDQVVRTVLLGIQGLMRDHSIEVVRGVGRLKSPNEIDVETDAGRSRFSASRVIIATGSSWALPPIPGIQGPGRVTVEELFSLDEIPRS